MYAVIDHHSIWGWETSNTPIESAEVVFVWNDFTIRDRVLKWQGQGKKVVCFEHGWSAFFDYELNQHDLIADGYIALGQNSANSLIRCGLNPKRVLVTGNPNFDDIPKGPTNQTPKVLYTALHWVRDMSKYNNDKLGEVIKAFNLDIYVKTNSKSKVDIPEGVGVWHSEINENTNLFTDIKSRLCEFDIILTPKESTFDFIALKAGKNVFRIGKSEEYTKRGEPNIRNVLPYREISSRLLKEKVAVDLKGELVKSIELGDILQWAFKLDGII